MVRDIKHVDLGSSAQLPSWRLAISAVSSELIPLVADVFNSEAICDGPPSASTLALWFFKAGNKIAMDYTKKQTFASD